MKKKTRPVIVVGSDHAGLGLKKYLSSLLEKKGYRVEDVGTHSRASVDYPDFAEKVGREVAGHRGKRGVLACGTGIGASIAANKIPGIRAGLANTPRAARLSREHNNTNVLVLEGRPYRKEKTRAILNSWLGAEFNGGRHRRRINKIARLEKKFRLNPDIHKHK